MNTERIKEMIQVAVQPSTVLVESEDGVHFNVQVISSVFAEKNRIDRQKLIYNALNEHLANGSIHALSLKTWTPEEWQANK